MCCHCWENVCSIPVIRKHLRNYILLVTLSYGASDISRRFDKTAKLKFRDPEEPQYIKFGLSSGCSKIRIHVLGFDPGIFD